MRDYDSAEILFQSLLQEALMISSGMNRDVQSLMDHEGRIPLYKDGKPLHSNCIGTFLLLAHFRKTNF